MDVGDWITECRDLAPFWGPENRPDLGPFWPGFWDSQIGVYWVCGTELEMGSGEVDADVVEDLIRCSS